ncbi:MAG: type II secretion system secretin GspD [Betaproteobacteria bacterium]|jgi:general secretion pathway protein D|nr:MAG: type II secretion system secretin GspD [Betaproteobacteria bacterium]
MLVIVSRILMDGICIPRVVRKGCERLQAVVVLVLSVLLVQSALAQENVRLNFVNADLNAVVRAIGHYTGRTFVVDPRVKGSLDLVSEKPLSRSQALSALTAALRLQGYAIVEVGGISRVVPEADAKFQGGSVDTSEVPRSVRGDQVITQVFRLRYESAANVLPVIRPLVPPNNPVIAYAGSNALVVTDYADNLRRIEKIIKAIDVKKAAETQVISLKHAIATDMAALVVRLNEQPGRSGQPPDPNERVTVVADPVTNSLIVRSKSAGQMRMVRSLVESLDRAGQAGTGVYVVPLKNAAAGSLAEVLTKVRIDGRDGGSAAQSGQAGPAGSATNAGATIVADEASNSLVISASESIYRKLRGVIDRLDVRRAQVYIEALLVEVQTDEAAEFGIQWITGLENISEGGTSIIGGTNFGDASQNIGSAAQDLTNLGQGLNIGVIRGEVTIPGVGTITNLNFLARALERTAKANILATPNILTLDNEEATIIVGENIPILTGQFVTQGAVNPNVNPFQTIERQDVGLTLRVKPQISEGGTIRLNLYQEASAVEDVVTNAGPVTRKRSLETNVLVDDGNIIVLGGLVQDEVADGTEKVPILGDIPLLGYLFRYDTRRRQKTNLMLFLRPYVIRDTDDSYSLTLDRYDMMRKLEREAQPESHFGLPSLEGPILPEFHLGQEPPADVPPGPATTPDTVQ